MSAALSLVGVALGCMALIVLCPQRAGLLPPTFPLAFGFGGMLLGWLFDLTKADPNPLNPICMSLAGTGFPPPLSLHFTTLPLMHISMLLGGLFAVLHFRSDP